MPPSRSQGGWPSSNAKAPLDVAGSTEGVWNVIDVHVGQRLRALRLRAQLSGAQMAASMGIDEVLLTALEEGTVRASPTHLRAACDALGEPISAIYEQLGGPPAQG